MVITLTGYIFIAVCLIFILFDIQYFFDLVILSLILQSSAFCIIGDFGVPLSIPIEIIFCCVCFLKCKIIKLHIKKTHFFLLIFTFWMLILTVMSPVLFQNLRVLNISTLSYEKLVLTWGKLSQGAFMLVNFCTFLVIYSQREHFNTDHMINVLKTYILLIFVIGIWHYYSVSTNGVSDLFLNLIYSNTGVSPGYHQTRFLATFYEPSYCGLFLSSMFWALTFYEDNVVTNNIFIFLCLLPMLCLNISSTGVFTFVLGGISYVIFWGNQKRKLKKIVLMITVGIIILSFMINSNFLTYEIIQRHVFKKMQSTSYYVRNTWNKAAIKTFVATNFWGVGSAYTRASSFLFNLLVQTGVIGTLFYILFAISLLIDQFKVKNKFSKFVLGYLIITFSGMLFSSPDVTMTNIWIGLFLAASNYDFKSSFEKSVKVRFVL